MTSDEKIHNWKGIVAFLKTHAGTQISVRKAQALQRAPKYPLIVSKDDEGVFARASYLRRWAKEREEHLTEERRQKLSAA